MLRWRHQKMKAGLRQRQHFNVYWLADQRSGLSPILQGYRPTGQSYSFFKKKLASNLLSLRAGSLSSFCTPLCQLQTLLSSGPLNQWAIKWEGAKNSTYLSFLLILCESGTRSTRTVAFFWFGFYDIVAW